MQYLILGADGYIGSFLYQQLIAKGCVVLGTSRRINNGNSLLFYDIQTGDIDNILSKINDKDKTAIICIANTKIDSCHDNFNQAYDINVIKTKELIHKLSKQDFYNIYFSSDNVFDGTQGNYTEESLTSPINKYGMMKAEMEKYILEEEANTCILRIPKVVSTFQTKQNILTEWENQIKKGYVHCIEENRISFVSIEDIYKACVIVAEQRMHGLYNIVGDESYSRAELANKFLNILGNTNVIVKEYGLEKFSFKDRRPLNVSMSNDKFKNKTGFLFMSMDEVIDKYIDNNLR